VDAKQVHQRGVELGCPPGTEHLPRGIHPIDPVEYLDVVGDLHHPHHGVDLLARAVPRDALAVPTFEGLLQCPADLVTQSQTAGDIPGGLAVAQHGAGGPVGSASQEPADHREPPYRARTLAHVPKHEPEHRRPDLVDLVAVRSQPLVVTEPGGQFMGVGHASHPGQQRHVKHRRLLPIRQAGRCGQAPGNHRLAQHMLLRLAQT
jgi:hypothetical protein